MHIRIILNEPLYAGNIGSIARVLKNFGYRDLVLVNPCPIDDEAWMMAQHAYDLLDGARVFETLGDATAGSNLIIGTTGMRGETTGRHIRMPAYTPERIREKLSGTKGGASVASIVFGREDHGLTNEELMMCDMLMSIPTAEQYPIMNLSHAVAVVLYELSDIGIGDILLADRCDLDLLYEHLEGVLCDLGYPAHKKHKTTLMLRRIFGRAELTAREVYTLRGILRLVDYRLRRGQVSRQIDFQTFQR
ncbi:MAG: RNA methyltransferase [Methanosarcinales archaeon]|nr:RNA methyltransferase [Methanosarcinales archaeon]